MKQLALLQKVHFLRLLIISLVIHPHQLKQQILPNLCQRLRHVNSAFECRVHRQEWRTLQFLKRRYQHDIDVLDVENVEVTNVILGLATVGKDLATDHFVKYLILGQVVLELVRAVRILGEQTGLTSAE